MLSRSRRQTRIIAIELSLVVALALCITAFRAPLHAAPSSADGPARPAETPTLIHVPPTKHAQPAVQPPPPAPLPPVEVPNETVLPDAPLDLDAPLVITDQPSTPPPPPQPKTSPAVDSEPFIAVEEMPALLGGLEALHRAVRYPDFARRAGIEGRVIVQFVVGTDGRVTEARVLRSPHRLLSEEALRVVRQARFAPGRQRGTAVPVRVSLPIAFALQ